MIYEMLNMIQEIFNILREDINFRFYLNLLGGEFLILAVPTILYMLAIPLDIINMIRIAVSKDVTDLLDDPILE